MGLCVLILMIIMVVATTLQILLTPKPKIEDARPGSLGDFVVPTATEDRSIPIMWGTVDITGPNVLWYGDLKVIRRRKTKGGMKILVAFEYFLGLDLLLCYGPIDRVTRFEVGDRDVYPNDGEVTPAFPVTPTAGGLPVEFSSKELFGGLGKGGSITGTVKIYSGDPAQIQDPYLQSQLGVDIPSYVNIAHIVFEQTGVGESTSIGAYVFRVSRFPDNLALDGTNHIVNGTIDDGDANPAEVIYEIMTSDVFGLDIDPSMINTQTFRDVGNALADEGNGVSWILTTVKPAIDVITEIMRQIDGVLFENPTGIFELHIARDNYVLLDLPLFDENNVIEVTTFSRTSWAGTQNHINIGYSDRAKDFQATGAMSQDLANVRIQGAEVRGDYKFPAVKTAATAQALAERELRLLSFPLVKIVFTTNREAASLKPGDVIRLSWEHYGIVNMAVRIGDINLGQLSKGIVTITGTQDVFKVPESIFAPPQPTGWNRQSDVALPLLASEELLREMPRLLGNLYPDVIVNPRLARTWSIVQAPASQPATLGVEVYVDDGGGAGFIEGFGDVQLLPTAFLDLEYPQATADIETSDLFSVENTIDLVNIENGAPSQIAAGFNLILIQGATQAEDEVVGFETLIDDGDGTFKFRNVHRGLMDTQARTHPVGAKCWLIGEGEGYSSSTFGDIQAITVKHITDTTTNTLDPADALSNAFSFDRRTQRPHHPADLTVNATRVPVVVDETADLAFAWAHRLNSDVILRDANAGDATGQDTEVEYDIEFRNAVTQAVLRSSTLTSAGAWLAFTYTGADLRSDTGEVGDFPLEVRLQARYAAGAVNNPANLASLQNILRQFNADMGSATVQSIDLNGTTEYLANTTAAALGLVDEWSINVWIRGTSSAAGGKKTFLDLDPTGSNNSRISLSLSSDSNGAPFTAQLFDSTGTFFKDYDFGIYTVNTWTMITVTWDGTTLTVYQDGVVQTPTLNLDNAGTMDDAARRVIVGADTALFASWPGQIFSPAIWTNELAAAEVAAIDAGASAFNLRANSGDYVSRDTLNHLWDFRTSASIGQDYRNSTVGTARDILANAVGITAADLNAGEVP